ncbi:MAG: hypothetical protein MJ077_07340 [Oscillospiraceae bacterium]|nr:hypothetical protein [Oscillospiraceae bacterium]
MKKTVQMLAIAGIVLFLLLNLVNLFVGVSDVTFAVVMTISILLFIPMVIVEVRKK